MEYVCHNYGIPHFVGLGLGLGVSFLLHHFNSLVFLYSDSGVRVSQLRYPPLCWPGCWPGGQRSRPSFHTQVNKFRCLLWTEPQSKQSAKLFLQSSELGLPQPLTRRLLCTPSFFRLRERGWGSPNSDERTYTVGIYLCTLWIE